MHTLSRSLYGSKAQVYGKEKQKNETSRERSESTHMKTNERIDATLRNGLNFNTNKRYFFVSFLIMFIYIEHTWKEKEKPQHKPFWAVTQRRRRRSRKTPYSKLNLISSGGWHIIHFSNRHCAYKPAERESLSIFLPHIKTRLASFFFSELLTKIYLLFSTSQFEWKENLRRK